MELSNFTRLLYCIIAVSCIGQIRGQYDFFLILKEQHAQGGRTTQVTFSNELFKQFHQCLCSDSSKACTARVIDSDTGLNLATDIRAVHRSSSHGEFAPFYNCTIKRRTNILRHVVCLRLHETNIPCNEALYFTSYKMPSVTSCTLECVGFLWNNRDEFLDHFRGNLIDYGHCKHQCYGISSASTISSTPVNGTSNIITTIITKLPTLSAIENSEKTTAIRKITDMTMTSEITKTTFAPENGTERSNIDSPPTANHKEIIIGVVVAILLTVIVAIVIFILWRRRNRLDDSVDTAETENPESSSYKGYANVSLNSLDTPAMPPPRFVPEYPKVAGPYFNEFKVSNNAHVISLASASTFPTEECEHVTSSYVNSKVLSDSDNGIKQQNYENVAVDLGNHSEPEETTSDNSEYDLAGDPQACICVKNSENQQNTGSPIINEEVADNNDKVTQETIDGAAKSVENNKPVAGAEEGVLFSSENVYAVIGHGEIADDELDQVNTVPTEYLYPVELKSAQNTGTDYGYACIDPDYPACGDSKIHKNKLNITTITSLEGTNGMEEITGDCDIATYDTATVPKNFDQQLEQQAVSNDQVSDDHYNTPEDEYCDVNEGNLHSKLIYSKLGHGVKKITGPYNILPPPKRDPVQQMPACDSLRQSANHHLSYTLAQAVPEIIETQADDVVHVGPPASTDLNKDANITEFHGNEATHLCDSSVSQSTITGPSDAAQGHQNVYFELEKDETAEGFVYDTATHNHVI